MTSQTKTITTKQIPVVVDKSHLITIGEKLYTEKMSFIRELVNNAYDADATKVEVELTSDKITVRDNGTGMSEAGLRQYFTIGSPYKKEQSRSPKYKRKRIGEFGIGKFAVLAACKKFEVTTRSGNFRAKLIFDKEAWSRHEDWHLDIEILPADPKRGDGATVTLHNLSLNLSAGRVRRYLSERTPIHTPNFAVYLNQERITTEIISGRQLPLKISTPYGHITGVLVIMPAGRRAEQLGIAVTVKGVLIRHETFGLQTSRKWGVTRLTGRINADWLPITSGRSDFIRDSAEFAAFTEAMQKEIKKALKLIKQEGDRRANLQASRILRSAMQKIGKAMKNHQELFPEAQVPLGTAAPEPDPKTNPGYEISQAEFLPSRDKLDPEILKRLRHNAQTAKRPKGRPRGILGNKSVIRTLRVADMEIAVRMEHLGTEDESLVSGGIIHINLDHPLYRTYQNNDDLLTQHIARIITKELALQTGIAEADRAFAIQAELLTDAFKGKLGPK